MNFNRGSCSREKVAQSREHCFTSPPLTAITHKNCCRVCSPSMWLPRPAVRFAQRTLWLECDCKGGAEPETKNLIHFAAARCRTTAHAFCTSARVHAASYQTTFLNIILGAALSRFSDRRLECFCLFRNRQFEAAQRRRDNTLLSRSLTSYFTIQCRRKPIELHRLRPHGLRPHGRWWLELRELTSDADPEKQTEGFSNGSCDSHSSSSNSVCKVSSIICGAGSRHWAG